MSKKLKLKIGSGSDLNWGQSWPLDGPAGNQHLAASNTIQSENAKSTNTNKAGCPNSAPNNTKTWRHPYCTIQRNTLKCNVIKSATWYSMKAI